MSMSRRDQPGATGHEEGGTQLFAEKDRIERIGRVRELVFGSLDGLHAPLKPASHTCRTDGECGRR